MATSYKCEAESIDAFVAQFVRYVASGHYFYVTARVPDGKDPQAVDRKLIQRYSIDRPRWKRKRRNLRENAGIHYLRYRRFFVVCLTKGRHDAFYKDHSEQVRDIRRTALRFSGYSIRYTFSAEKQSWKVFVRLDRETYRTVKAHMLELATRPRYRDPKELEREFLRLPYQGYDPVRRQLVDVAAAVNRLRRRAGYARMDFRVISKKRVRVTRVFVDDVSVESPDQAA